MVLTKAKVLVNNSEYVDSLFSVSWDQPHLNFSDIPTFEFDTDNYHGRNYNTYNIGQDLKIYRNGSLEFYGTIEPKSFSKGKGGSTVKVKGKHKGYLNMQKTMCEGYKTPEGFVNPWQWGRKDINGNEVDGINPSDIMRNLFGTLFTFQEFYDNAKNFMSKDTVGASGFINIAIVDIDGLGTTKLMAKMSGTGFNLGETNPGVGHSVSLRNTEIVKSSNNTIIRQMGEISKVKYRIVGDYNNIGNPPIIAFCRNGNDTITNRNYVTGSLLIASGSNPTGSNVVWTGQIIFSGSEGHKNAIGYKIYPNGNATGFSTTTNKIDYLRFDATTVSDIGLTEGEIETYVDTTSSSGDSIVINLLGLNRLEAAERVRKLTLTPDNITDSPHWDAWIDNELKAYFKSRRGTIVDSEYSFAKYNLLDIEHSFDANNLVNNIIAKGQGTPPNQATIVSTDLVDLASVQKYGSRQGVFQDTSIKDLVTLQRRAKAYLKLYKDPIETVKLSIINDWKKPWNVGDSIKVRDTDIGVDGNWRIISAKHKIRGEGIEQIDIELGNKSFKARDLLKGIGDGIKDQEIFYQGTQSQGVTSSLGIDFDVNKPAVYNFIIPDNVDIDRVYLYAKTDVFKSNTRSAAATTIGSEAVVAGGGGGQDIRTQNLSLGNGWTTLFSLNTFANTIAVYFAASIQPEANAAISCKVRIRDDLGNTYESVEGSLRNFDQAGSYTHITIPNLFVIYPRNALARTLHFEIFTTLVPAQNCYVFSTVTSSNSTSHNHGSEGHVHKQVFGIYEFPGDAETFGGPMYPTKIQMFVDKLPTDPGAVAFDGWGTVGKVSGSVTIDRLDITSALKDENGLIKPGSHFIAFKPFSGQFTEAGINDTNVQNLGRITLNHFISFNTKGTQE